MTDPDPQDVRLQNQKIIARYVCRECYESGTLTRLVEKRSDGQYILVCAEHPSHEQHIKEVTASARLRQQRHEAIEVFSNYPFLDPSPITESAAESIAMLSDNKKEE